MKKPRAKKKPPKPAPEAMVFEHVPVEQRPYDRIAARVLAAVEELNNALTEAHECAEMRVFIGATKADGHAMRFQPQIYSLTHSTLAFQITVDDDGKVGTAEKSAWRYVKDPAFRDAAGQGLNKFKDRSGSRR